MYNELEVGTQLPKTFCSREIDQGRFSSFFLELFKGNIELSKASTGYKILLVNTYQTCYFSMGKL